jgi:predicted transcriptional regulator
VIRSVYEALAGMNAQVEAAVPDALKPAVPIRKSVMPDFIVCLEDGK